MKSKLIMNSNLNNTTRAFNSNSPFSPNKNNLAAKIQFSSQQVDLAESFPDEKPEASTRGIPNCTMPQQAEASLAAR